MSRDHCGEVTLEGHYRSVGIRTKKNFVVISEAAECVPLNFFRKAFDKRSEVLDLSTSKVIPVLPFPVPMSDLYADHGAARRITLFELVNLRSPDRLQLETSVKHSAV